jgi:peptide/nickel transport system substrate-binding protein
MSRRRRALYAVVSTLVLAIGLSAGCGSKKKKDAKKRAAPTPATQTGDRYGGNLRLESPEPQYLNPVLQTRFERVNAQIFEGLVGLDARLEPVPRLAESWKLSESGKVVTFNLRKDVKWHDGEPFTARDVKFTYDAIMGVQAPTLWKAYFENVDSVEITDDHTVVVVYKKPYALAVIAWTVGIIAKHQFEGEGDLAKNPANEAPVGTGPFRLARWEQGKRIVLAANKDYWNGRPYLDNVEVVVGLSGPEIMNGLRTGKLDFVEIPDIKTWANEAQLPEFQEKFEVKDVVEPGFQVIAWNLTRELTGNQKVRLALTHAINRSRIIDDVLLGQARPLSAPYFPNMFGADRSIAPHPFDLDRAVKLLDEAGYPSKDGQRFNLEMMVSESSRGYTTDEVLALIRHDFAAIGIDLKVSYVTPREFSNRAILREFDAAYFGWLPDIPDPDPYALLHSSQIPSGSIHAGYANPEVDRLLDEARAASDRDERKVLYQKVHAIIHKELPYTPLFADYGHYAYTRRLVGVNPNDVGPQPRFPGVARWRFSEQPHAGRVAKPAR